MFEQNYFQNIEFLLVRGEYKLRDVVHRVEQWSCGNQLHPISDGVILLIRNNI